MGYLYIAKLNLEHHFKGLGNGALLYRNGVGEPIRLKTANGAHD
jgi:hypothetical protein